MQTLNEIQWLHFKMPEVFEVIQRGKRLKKADHIPGTIPYVSSTANNNGVDGYIEATPGTRVFGDCISLANSGSVGTAFYEPFDFVASDHVTALKTIGRSRFAYLFMTSSIEKQGSNFNFNREINEARIMNMQFMLPVDDNGEPDYEYMEQYAAAKHEEKLAQYRKYVQKRIDELGDYAEIPALHEKEWAGYEVGRLFKTNKRGKKTYIQTGALVDGQVLEDGDIPRIRVTASNNGINGITNRVNDHNFRTYSNFVSMSFLGSAFYHPYEASLDMKVHCLQLLNRELTPALGLFVSVMVMHNATGTNYGNQLSSEDLVSKRILLPINGEGEPDFEYMEHYGKNMMLRKYRQYLAYLDYGSEI